MQMRPYECALCREVCRSVGQLRRHLYEVHRCGQGPSSSNPREVFSCSLCHFKANKKYYLKRHTYEVHNPKEAVWNTKGPKKGKKRERLAPADVIPLGKKATSRKIILSDPESKMSTLAQLRQTKAHAATSDSVTVSNSKPAIGETDSERKTSSVSAVTSNSNGNVPTRQYSKTRLYAGKPRETTSSPVCSNTASDMSDEELDDSIILHASPGFHPDTTSSQAALSSPVTVSAEVTALSEATLPSTISSVEPGPEEAKEPENKEPHITTRPSVSFNLQFSMTASWDQNGQMQLNIVGSEVIQPAPLALRLNPPAPRWTSTTLPRIVHRK